MPKRRLLPTEIRLVEDILVRPEEDATLVAREILAALNEKRQYERTYVVLLWDRETRKFLSAWGPYSSVKSADADLRVGGVIPQRNSTATLVGLISSDTIEEDT